MGSKAGGSLATFILSVPVSAILLMAIFGIPRFAPGVNGDGDEEGKWQDPRQFLSGLAGNDSAEDEIFTDYTPRPGRADHSNPFSGGDAAAWDSADPRARSAQPPASPDRQRPDVTERGQAAPRWHNEPGRRREDVRAPREDAQAPPPRRQFPFPIDAEEETTVPSQLTWTEARRRLAELGVGDFHLEPGHQKDSFLFVCLFSPGDDPRVTQRFEAEASEPLAAVESVLEQIEGWLNQRYSEQTRRVVSPFNGR